MQKKYQARRDVSTIFSSVITSVFGGLMLGLLITLIINPLRGQWWVCIVTILGLLIVNIFGFIKSRNSFYAINNGEFTAFENKNQKWSIPINQITEIDSKQVHSRRKYRSGSTYNNIAFLILAGGKEYEALEVMDNYDKFLEDIKQINPNIQITDLTTKSETEYMQAGVNAERENKYNPDNPLSKLFGKWLPPQVITYAAAIIVIALVILLIYALSK